jgi:thioredoxin-related protein
MRLFFLLFLIIINIKAEESIFWQKNYEEALLFAQKEKKDIMLLVSKPHCRWCKKMKFITLEDKGIIIRLRKNYVFIKVMRDDNTYPKRLKATFFPMIYFLTNRGKKYLKVGGYWGVNDFHSWLDEADKLRNNNENG